MKNIKRKGFTLVELLIVIVVIGILSAMMMLSSTEAVTSAKASNIVSNLRNFKTAAMAMYVDYLDKMDAGDVPAGSGSWVKHSDFSTATTTYGNDEVHKLLVKYMNKGDSNTGDADIDHYHIVKGTMTRGTSDTVSAYFVGYNAATDTRVQEKLAGRAKSVGLLGTTTVDNTTTTNTNVYSSGNTVYMFVTQCNEAASDSAGGGNESDEQH